MTTPEPPPGAPQPAELRCPRCSATIAPEQDWCLNCGAAARTRLAPTPNWKVPVAGLATIAALAGLALAIAFVTLTDDDAPVTATTPTTAAPPAGITPPAATTPPATTVPPATTTPPATTVPPATTTPPATTVPPATTTPPATTAPPAITVPPGTTTPPR